MTDLKIQELWNYGHFRNPALKNGESWNVEESDLPNIRLEDAGPREALASYQNFMGVQLDLISLGVHNRPSIPDGDSGPATEMLFNLPRCACPDFAMEATGQGSWPANCYPNDWPDTHAVKIAFDKSGMRNWMEPVFESDMWPIVHKSFYDIGLKLIREDHNDRAHMQASFVRPDGAWIGLAIVPGHTSCTLSIWQKYDRDYRPQNLVPNWVSLLKHEIGHNLNLGHTRGGVMNPGIIDGLPYDWFGVGDPSEPILRQFFGGEPVGPPPDPGPKVWTHYGYKDETSPDVDPVWITLRPPIPRE